MHARYILGMDRSESDALLFQLAEHLVDERFAYFHDWQENDMLAWDN
jgi:taurine dioxygenase